MKYTFTIALILVYLSTLFGQKVTSENHLSVGEVIEFESEILGETRQIYLYQPQGFWGMDEKMKNLPVIYVLDGESQFLNTVSTVDFLSSAPLGNDLMPRSIVVGIPNTNRNRDLSPIKGVIANDSTTLEITGGGKKFLNFITQELIPYVDSQYETSEHRTIIGHSLGGLLAFEALLRKPTFFDNYLVIDPGFGFADEAYLDEVVDSLQNSNYSNEHVFFTTAETRPTFLMEQDLMSDTSDIVKLLDLPNRKFLGKYKTSKWRINLSIKHYPNESHFSVPVKATFDGLKKLYDYYSFPEIIDYYHPKYKEKSGLLQELIEHYKMISAKMGYEIMPMEGYLNSFAYGLVASGRADLGISLFEYNITLRPDNPIVYNNLGYYYMSTGKTRKAIEVYKKSLKIKSDEWVIETIKELEKTERDE